MFQHFNAYLNYFVGPQFVLNNKMICHKLFSFFKKNAFQFSRRTLLENGLDTSHANTTVS